MWEKEWKRLWLALRGGIVLGLGLTAVWFLALTAGDALPDKLSDLLHSPQVGVQLLEQQTGLSLERLTGTGLTGWGSLVLKQSPWLQGGPVWPLESESQPVLPDPPAQPPEDPESGEISLTDAQSASTDILEITSKGEERTDVLFQNGVYLLNKRGTSLTGEEFSTPTPVPQWEEEGPQILILHTHGSEAYTQSGEDTYEESDPYRTTNCTQNVVRVGEEMAMELRAHGFRVIHDTNLYDYPSYNGAYDRSGAAVEQWLAQYPSIRIILDVHRDALVGEGGQPYALVSTEAGTKVAQVMLVVGDHSRWQENLSFAAFLQRDTMKRCTSLTRPMVLRGSQFNQQLSPFSLLVEVGGHGNTLQQAIDGGRLFADSMARSLKELTG